MTKEDGRLQRVAALLKKQRAARYEQEAVAGDGDLVDAEDAREIIALIEADRPTVDGLVKWRDGGVIFDALCAVRRRNAGDFSGKLTSAQSQAYDRAVLDCFAGIDAALAAHRSQERDHG